MNKRIVLALLLSAFCQFSAVQDTPTIVKKHLAKKCSRERTKQDDITHIMIHFCSYAIESPENPYQLDKVIDVFENFGVSANYLIDRKGVIYELVPENRVAYHAGKGKLPHEPYYPNSLNGHSIGIELLAIGTEKEMEMFMSKESYRRIAKENIGFTASQYSSLNWLLDDLLKKYPTVKKNRQQIVGHDEYAPDRRTDPGSLFDWKKIGL